LSKLEFLVAKGILKNLKIQPLKIKIPASNDRKLLTFAVTQAHPKFFYSIKRKSSTLLVSIFIYCKKSGADFVVDLLWSKVLFCLPYKKKSNSKIIIKTCFWNIFIF